MMIRVTYQRDLLCVLNVFAMLASRSPLAEHLLTDIRASVFDYLLQGTPSRMIRRNSSYLLCCSYDLRREEQYPVSDR